MFHVKDKNAKALHEALGITEARSAELAKIEETLVKSFGPSVNIAEILAKMSEHVKTDKELALSCFRLGANCTLAKLNSEAKGLMPIIGRLIK